MLNPVASPHYTIQKETEGVVWRTYAVETLTTKEACKIVERQCFWDGATQRSLAVLKGSVALLAICALSVLGYFGAKAATTVAGYILLPLIIIPPLYGLLLFATGACVFGATLHFGGKSFAQKYFREAQNHWAYADHLYQQRINAQIRATKL